jgi:hypothetical protein
MLYLPFLSLILSSFPVDGRTPVGGGGGRGRSRAVSISKGVVLVLQDWGGCVKFTFSWVLLLDTWHYPDPLLPTASPLPSSKAARSRRILAAGGRSRTVGEREDWLQLIAALYLPFFIFLIAPLLVIGWRNPRYVPCFHFPNSTFIGVPGRV